MARDPGECARPDHHHSVAGAPVGLARTNGATMSEPDSPASRFDRRASSYQDSPLQQFLFVPVQQTALRLARQLQPQARRILDVGCGTGQLLRHARPCYPTAQLVGVDLAGQMVATARAITPTKLEVRYVHGRAECLPFTDEVFDLVFTTLSLRHWTDLSAGIAEIGRVLTPGGLLVLADVLPSCHRRGPALPSPPHTASPPRHRPGRPGSCAGRPPPSRHRQRSHPLVPAP